VQREFSGWRRVDTAVAGDIGIVEAATARGCGLVGGLCLGDRWAVLTATGLIVGVYQPVAVWSASCPR
jgi:hypothetical protein